MAARGAASILAMFMIGRLMTQLDPRVSMIDGAALVAGSLA
jgi:hypothetical protein